MPILKDILLIQKRELEAKLSSSYIKRDADLAKLNNDLIKVIIGPRRAGKSFFAIHALNNLGAFAYANFDDEKLVETENYDEIIDTLKSLYPNSKYFLFDEIQNLDKWELFVNRLHRQGFNLVLTGSNSKLLSRELATHLTGRHLQIVLFPLTFKEFLGSQELTTSEIKTKLEQYLTYGGYPEPFVKQIDYKDYLSTLFSSIIYKDIVKRFKIRSVQAIEDLATYLISNVASEFSFSELSMMTKCKSMHTVEKYLRYLEEAFLFFKLDKFSYKTKERISTNKKIYCIDNGFFFAKAFKFTQNRGKLFENTVAISLKKLEEEGKINFYYWKNQSHGVDFVIKKGLTVKQLIQVSSDVTDSKVKDRETHALLAASKELNCKDLLVITDDYESEEKVKWFDTERKVKFVPLWKWLLNNKV